MATIEWTPKETFICFNPGKNTGVVAVGEYDYSNTYDDNTQEMTRVNGPQVMAKAYSQLKPGDAVTYIRKTDGNGRHVRLVIDVPHVEFTIDENGEQVYDMEKSYITILDQAGGSSNRFIKEENKSSFHEVQYNFNHLVAEGSLPISISELTQEGAYVEEDTYVSSFRFADVVFFGWVKSNRQIISVRAVIDDGEKTYDCPGNVVMANLRTPTNYHLREYDLTKLDLGDICFIRGKEYTFNLYVLTSGNDGVETNLIKDYKFTV